MSSYGLATNIDTTYSDGVDASIPLHQRDHDKIHAAVNWFDKDTARTAGMVWRYDGSLFVPAKLGSGDVATMDQDTVAGAYAFVLADAGRTKFTSTSDTAPLTYTIPLNSTVPFPVGTSLAVVQWGTGQVTVAGESASVLLRAPSAALRTSVQYAGIIAIKRFTDTWWVTGQAVI